MTEQFISEPIRPVEGTFQPAAMTRGEPALPKQFHWRDTKYTVEKVIGAWKESGPDKSASCEMYLRKHWFQVKCTNGTEMKIYFLRQPSSKKQDKVRWWIYTIKET